MAERRTYNPNTLQQQAFEGQSKLLAANAIIRYPCVVTAVGNSTVDVEIKQSGADPIQMIGVPISQTSRENIPNKVGDIGYLESVGFDVDSFIQSQVVSPPPIARGGSLTGLIFYPLRKTTFIATDTYGVIEDKVDIRGTNTATFSGAQTTIGKSGDTVNLYAAAGAYTTQALTQYLSQSSAAEVSNWTAQAAFNVQVAAALTALLQPVTPPSITNPPNWP